MMIKPEVPDIDTIQERVTAATPGPWVVRVLPGGRDCFVQAPKLDPKHPYHIEVLADSDGAVVNGQQLYPDQLRANDVTFVAHARQDVPLLIEYIRYLESVLDTAGVEY